jgi:hypothetical protein
MTPPPTTSSPATPSRDGEPRRPSPGRRAPRRPSELPREHRIGHVFRTLGRGLVAEYEPG